MTRRRVATACAVVMLAAACTSDGGAPDGGAPASVPSAVGEFRDAVDHTQAPAPGPAGAGKLAWTSSWRLSWAPVPGATSYAVHYGTNEGPGGAPKVQPGTELSVEAAAGTSPVASLEKERRAALLFTSSQLLVSVGARSDAGEGPRSAWFPVGDVPASGRPIGQRSLGAEAEG